MLTLQGLPLGLFQTTTVMYALEVAPISLRAYLTNYVNFCWVRIHKPQGNGNDMLRNTGVWSNHRSWSASWYFKHD
jgi:SP family general alpha glucoside:H+ symporter-like MFS transporter